MRFLPLLVIAAASLGVAQEPIVIDLGAAKIPGSRLQALLGQKIVAHPPSSVTVLGGTIDGPLSLAEWDLPFIMRFSRCTFGGDVTMRRLHTDRSLLFEDCRFGGRADFSEVHVGRDLQAERCTFVGTQAASERKDDEPISFIHSAVGDDFSVNDSIFQARANFRHMRVGRDFYAQNAAFLGGEPDPDGERGQIYDVKLEGTSIDHFLRIDGVMAKNPKTRISINDCTFAGIFAQTGDGSEASEERLMLAMLEDLQYRDGTYDLIEREFLRRGRRDLADDVFIHGKDRETHEARGFAKVRGVVLKFVAGYGRQPALAFAWCFLAVLIGMIAFVREDSAESDHRRYLHSFWYSLDLFIPFVSATGKEPEPPKGTFARSYVRIHRIIGWILLPIALGSISGVVGG